MTEPPAAELPAAPDGETLRKPKVIYVLGAHRSGSTVLGVALGNCEGVFFGGELHAWQSRRGVPSIGGERGAQLWREVLARVDGAEELFGDETQFYIDRSSALYRVHRWPARRRLKGRYRRMAEDLFRAIAEVTHSTHVVDSSHYPLRARELQSLAGIDLYLLFLARDPQGIVTSMGRGKGRIRVAKGPLTANLQLGITYLLSLLVFLRQPRERRLFVRHEDFLADPDGLLRQILAWADSPSAVPDLTALTVGCPLQGNRFMKQADVIAVRAPTAPEARASLMTRVMQSPWPPILSRLQPAARPLRGPSP